MYCRDCGTPNDDNVCKCINCGKVMAPIVDVCQTGDLQKVPSRLAPAILTTLFCCVPFGIVAIVYAAQVNAKLAAGNSQGALEDSKKATMWCWIALGLGIIPMIYWVVMIFYGFFGYAAGQC
jgi:hypothetical protein